MFKKRANMFISYLGSSSFKPGMGYLYNQKAIFDTNFAPSGWKVPSDDDWKTLELYLGMSQSNVDGTGWRGTNEGGKLKKIGFFYWYSPNLYATDEYGFGAIPGQHREHEGQFLECKLAHFWCRPPSLSSSYVYARTLSYENGEILRLIGTYYNMGLSVRLLKNDSNLPSGNILTDYDNNEYPCVKIGDQVWIAKNWKCTHLNDGTEIPYVYDDNDWLTTTRAGFPSTWTMGLCAYLNNLDLV